MKNAITLFLILAIAATPALALAKGGGGGGRGGGGFRSAPSSRPVSTPTKPAVAPAPAKPAVAPAPSTKPTSNTVKTTAPAPKTVGGKTYSKTGNVVGEGYQPKFKGGVVPPAGSVVYYRDNSILDWIPLWYIMTHDSHRDAVVETKTVDADGKEIISEQVVEEEGTDSMFIINWILTILLAGGLIAGIVWLVNNATNKPKRSYV